MSKFGEIGFADTGALDAFNALRVSQKRMLFQTQNQYGIDSITMETGITSSGTANCLIASWNSSDTMVTLSSNTSGNGTCSSWIQSYQYYPYEAGFSEFIAITGVFGASASGWTKEFMFGDSNNGVIFRQNPSTGLEIALRTSTSGVMTETSRTQSAWNIDTLGAVSTINPSRKTFDVTKTFIFGVDLQYLGMGRVRTFMDIDGVIYYLHEFLNAGNMAVPYMQTATLPIAAVLTGASPSTSTSMKFKCATIQSENGVSDIQGYEFDFPSKVSNSGTINSGVKTHMCSIRPRTTFNSQTNRIMILPTGFYINNSSTRTIDYELSIGVTFTNALTTANIHSTYSCVEYTSGGGSIVSSGVVIARGSILSGAVLDTTIDSNKWMYPLTLNRYGLQRDMGTLTLSVTPLGGNSAASSIDASISFKEIRR